MIMEEIPVDMKSALLSEFGILRKAVEGYSALK
jgi:hypothetical protein